jgi:ribosome-associated protein
MTDWLNLPSSPAQTSLLSTSTPNLARGEAVSSRDLALLTAHAADDRKGSDIVVLQVADVSYLADFFVIVTGFSRAQVRAIANQILEQGELEGQRIPRRLEGQADASWILMDYGDVIVHVMLPQERDFYNLEAFWGHSEQIPFMPTSGG